MSRILLVEDEEHLAEGLAFNLRNSGYEVDIASTGEAALAKVEARSPAPSGAVELSVFNVTLGGA